MSRPPFPPLDDERRQIRRPSGPWPERHADLSEPGI